MLNRRREEEPTSNEVLITRTCNAGHGIGRTASPALAPRALFKETTLIKRCSPSARRGAARLGRSELKFDGEKKYRRMEVVRGKPASRHVRLHGGAPGVKRVPGWEQGRAGEEEPTWKKKSLQQSPGHGEGGPQLGPGGPAPASRSVSSKIDATPSRGWPCRGDGVRKPRHLLPPKKAPDLSLPGQGRSPSHEQVREQGDTSLVPPQPPAAR